MTDALELMRTRRSVKPMEMTGPGPTPAEIDALLTIASRVPDHGKLAPWRFIVFEGEGLRKASLIVEKGFKAKFPTATDEQAADAGKRFAQAPLVGAGAGMDMHHKEGYNAAYMDGHAQFLIDVDRIVADAMTSNMAFSELEGHWRNFFDRE